jgi:hypothetical protein
MLPLLVLLSSFGAQAAEWSDFSGAFPVKPCPDGWVACVIGGTVVDPEMRPDGAGVPTPADLRVSWFDLKARPGFDPFSGLSVYPDSPRPEGELVAAVATPPVVAPPTVAPPTVAPPTLAPLEVGTPAVTPPVVRPPVLDPDDGVADLPDGAATTPIPRPRLPSCTLDDELFARARGGKLSDSERGCLDAQVQTAGSLTQRGQASRPLIADAFARNDREQWAKLVKRHLDDIERSDPALAMSYAKHLSRGGTANAEAVLYWSDVALENRTIWQGQTYVTRTLALRRLKALAAGGRWQALEKAKAAGESVDPGQLEKWRVHTRTFAMEWYEYSVSAARPEERALALCASASRSTDACR